MLILRDNTEKEIHFYTIIMIISGIATIIGCAISAFSIHFLFKETKKKEDKDDETIE